MTSGVSSESSPYLNRIKNETSRIQRRRTSNQRSSSSHGQDNNNGNEQSTHTSATVGLPGAAAAAATQSLGTPPTSSTSGPGEAPVVTRPGESHKVKVERTRLGGELCTENEPEVDEYEVFLKPSQDLEDQADHHRHPILGHQSSDLRGDSFSGGIGNNSASFEDPVPRRKMSSSFMVDHEAFRKQLIDEVLGKDSGDKVPMEKVVMIIWQYRDDPTVVRFMTRFVAKFSGSRDVFDGIEFYLPQLAHMIIHLQAEWDDAVLERFSLVIAQQSLHFALQLNWILQGALEDYRPELPDGTPNPNDKPLYYSRCIKLITNIERCVVYRRPRSQELQRLYEKGKITKTEMQNMELADRRFNAMQITADDPPSHDDIFGGNLMYKRAVRMACYKAKPWRTRYFAIEERMLNCYNQEGGQLKRSMPLEGATVAKVAGKYPHMFSVSNRSYDFRMRASSAEERNKWMQMLEDDANTHPVFGHTANSLFQTHQNALRVIEEMTPPQRARYEFFRDERDFVRRLTDIADDLRFEIPSDRKSLAPGVMESLKVPPCVYSPLVNSTDIFRRIDSVIFKDTRVFNTKARCPMIMYFVGVRGEIGYKGVPDANLDVAEYMYLKFDSHKEESFAVIPEGKEVDENGGTEEKEVSTEDGDTALASLVQREADAEQVGKLFGEDVDTRSVHSNVWHDSITSIDAANSKKDGKQGPPSPARGNRHLNKFLRESFVSVPRKLAVHLDRQASRRPSKSAGVKGLHSVPIVDGKPPQGEKDNNDIYVGRTSVFCFDHNSIIKGHVHEGDIDLQSIERANAIVNHGESWAEKSFRMLEEIKDKPKDVQLEVVGLMSKSNDDLRQEVFVMQMIHYYKSVFIDAGLPLWLKTYRILSTSGSTGLIQVLVDATSIDGLKKSEGYPTEGGLRKYFDNTYGSSDSKSFKAAQRNFMTSLAAYSIVSYLLGLKDRHNGNIMIDTRGHLIFIDFGFAMGMAPGHEFSMERAPFKLTEEYVEVMDGPDGECYQEFVRLFVEGFKAARKNSQIAVGLIEITMYHSNYPCFSGVRYGNGIALQRFQRRLMLNVPDDKVEMRAKNLINLARNHWGTRAYDAFQKWSNGYAT